MWLSLQEMDLVMELACANGVQNPWVKKENRIQKFLVIIIQKQNLQNCFKKINLLKAYQMFYPEDTLPTNVRDSLIALGNANSTTTDTDRWKNILLGICGSTEWWIRP